MGKRINIGKKKNNDIKEIRTVKKQAKGNLPVNNGK